MKVKAQSKWVRSSARKIRRIMNLIRGKGAKIALAQLKFYPQKGARFVEKALASAIANAKHNFKLNEDSLYISEAYVDEGTTLKRFKAASRGRAAPRKRRSAHVTVFVSPIEKKEPKEKKEKEGKHGAEGTPKRV